MGAENNSRGARIDVMSRPFGLSTQSVVRWTEGSNNKQAASSPLSCGSTVSRPTLTDRPLSERVIYEIYEEKEEEEEEVYK